VLLLLAGALSGCSGSFGARQGSAAGTSGAPAASRSVPPEATGTPGATDTGVDVPRDVLAGVFDARDLMTVVSQLTQNRPQAHLVVTAGSLTMAGVQTWVDHVGEEFELDVTQGSAHTRLVLIDATGYLQLSAPFRGRHWLRVDWDTTDPTLRPMAHDLDLLRMRLTPMDGYGRYTERVPITAPGSTPAGPVGTTAYGFTLTTAQLIAGLPEGPRDPLAASLAGETSSNTWYLDRSGLPRKISQTYRKHGKTLTWTYTYTAWGAPVQVHVPAASDVTRSAPVNLTEPAVTT
jgi:hypothetical protein